MSCGRQDVRARIGGFRAGYRLFGRSCPHAILWLQLQAAYFGVYVDPGMAERVLEEGVASGGEDVELSVLSVDVRDFTALAERSSARDFVARLNELFDTVMPVVVRHGGHRGWRRPPGCSGTRSWSPARPGSASRGSGGPGAVGGAPRPAARGQGRDDDAGRAAAARPASAPRGVAALIVA